MTKRSVYCPCPECKQFLGNVNGNDYEDTVSKHLIFAHPQVSKYLVEIGLKIEEYQKEFKKVSGMYARDAIHSFVNQNTMRALGWTEKEIDKHMKSYD